MDELEIVQFFVSPSDNVMNELRIGIFMKPHNRS